MATPIYLIGVVLGLAAVFNIWKMNITLVGKIICTIGILCLSWLGIAIYYLYAKNHIQDWFK